MKIDWLPWQKETFERALKEERPILLSITATWCHWCHVMDEKTYAKDEVARVVEENFVPIRVDTDERPDVNERYNQGGWPSTVFLAPRGEIITGTTYVPPAEMIELLEQVVSIFRRSKTGSQPSGIWDQKNSGSGRAGAEKSFEEKRIHFIKYREIFLRRFEQILSESFDPVYGGFGLSGPKFPQVEALEYCLVKSQKDDDHRFRQMLTKSLEAMAENGLFDHLEGGFFRYATDRAWQSPHFEKMLEDNARLAKLYFDAYRFLGDRLFFEVSQRTVGFIKNWLYDVDEGGFLASVDADEEYYHLASRGERLSYRAREGKPAVDTAIYANLNGLTSDCLFWLGEKEMSSKSFGRVLKENRSPNGLLFHCVKNGQGFLPGLLADQIAMASAWFLYTDPARSDQSVGRSGDDGEGRAGPIRTKNDGETATAESLWLAIIENFYDQERGGFFDRLMVESQEFGLLKEPRKDLDENVKAIQILRNWGQAEEAKKSLIEIFWLNQNPTLNSGSLATLLLN